MRKIQLMTSLSELLPQARSGSSPQRHDKYVYRIVAQHLYRSLMCSRLCLSELLTLPGKVYGLIPRVMS